MRIRTIKPEFWSNEKLCTLSECAHLVAAALLNYCDDEGYFNANPALIQAALFPLREPSESIPVVLLHLSKLGYLRLGKAEDGRCYGHILEFVNHQSINKPGVSKIKGLRIVWECSDNPPVALPEDYRGEQGTGNREQGGVERSSALPRPVSKPVCTMPLIDGTEYPITELDIAEWREAFPAADVVQELREMRVWCNANKANRKTKTGVLRFIARWLAKEQDRGGRAQPTSRDEFAGVK